MRTCTNNGKEHSIPSVQFDYDALDQDEPVADNEFWAAQGELLGDILRWLTAPRSLSRVGARCYVLSLYLNPAIIGKCSLKQIATMRGSVGVSALSKAMIEFQKNYNLRPGNYQKVLWMRDRYRRSALVRVQIDKQRSEPKQ
jgi:hypothetical protein